MRAVRRVVALQQEAVQLFVVRGRVGHEVHLVAQRALVQVEIDRRRVAPVATEAHVPARDLSVVLDGLHPRLARDRPFEVRGDHVVLGASHLRSKRRVADPSTAPRQSQRHRDRRARRGRRRAAAGGRPSCSTSTAASAPRPYCPSSRGELRVAEQLVDRHRVRRADRGRRRGIPFRRRRRANAGRRPRRRRQACRRPRPRARRARTTRCATARRTRRRRGRSRRDGRAAAAARSGSGRPRRGRAASWRTRRNSSAPSGPLGPPTTTSVAVGSSSAARQRTARSTPFNGWMRPDEQQHAIGVDAERAARAAAVSPGENTWWSTPGGTTSTRSRIGAVERRRAARARRRSTRASGRRTRRPRARHACDARDRRRRRRRPSRARACGTSRRAAGRAGASAGARPRPTTSSCRAAPRPVHASRMRCKRSRRRTARRARASACFGTGRARSGVDVQHAKSGLDLDDRRLRAVLGARVARRTRRRRARRRDASARTYTFIPPPSPAPGCASGDVCIAEDGNAAGTASAGRLAKRAAGPGSPSRGRARQGQPGFGRRARPGTNGRSRCSTCFWRSVIVGSSHDDGRRDRSDGRSRRVVEDAGPHVERLGRDPQPAAMPWRISADGLRSPRSIWLRYGLEMPGQLAQLPQRQPRVAPLVADELAEIVQARLERVARLGVRHLRPVIRRSRRPASPHSMGCVGITLSSRTVFGILRLVGQ